MTSPGGTEQLPKSLRDKHYKPPPWSGWQRPAGSVESKRPPFLQRCWEQRLQAHAVWLRRPGPRGRREKEAGETLISPRAREEDSTAVSPGSCRGDFKFLFRAAVIKTITQKSWEGQPKWKVKDLSHPNVRCTFPPVPREGTFYIKEQGTSQMWIKSRQCGSWSEIVADSQLAAPPAPRPPPPSVAPSIHSAFQFFPLKVKVLVTQSCPTLWDPYGL